MNNFCTFWITYCVIWFRLCPKHSSLFLNIIIIIIIAQIHIFYGKILQVTRVIVAPANAHFHTSNYYIFFCFILRITSFIHTFHSYKTKIGKSCVCVYFYYMTLPLFSYMEFCFYFPYALLVCMYILSNNEHDNHLFLFVLYIGRRYVLLYVLWMWYFLLEKV